jgi:hypothetical protein
MANPIFKVGMLFESVEVLRKAVTEYSVKQRVDNTQIREKEDCNHEGARTTPAEEEGYWWDEEDSN